jgi:hypothetical protein
MFATSGENKGNSRLGLSVLSHTHTHTHTHNLVETIMGLLLDVAKRKQFVSDDENGFPRHSRFYFLDDRKLKVRPKKKGRRNGGKTRSFRTHIGVGLFIRSYRPKHDTSCSLPNDWHADS